MDLLFFSYMKGRTSDVFCEQPVPSRRLFCQKKEFCLVTTPAVFWKCIYISPFPTLVADTMFSTRTLFPGKHLPGTLACVFLLLLVSGLLPVLVGGNAAWQNSSALSPVGRGRGDDTREIEGDLVIGSGENRTMEDEIIILSGNLLLEENATLIFRNMTVFFNSNAMIRRAIQLSSNSSFYCYDSRLTVKDRNYDFSFSVPGRLYMEDSWVSRVFGQSNDGYWGGISILSKNNISTMKGCLINDSYIGVNAFSSVTVRDTDFVNCSIGVNIFLLYEELFDLDSDVLFKGTDFQDCGKDILLREATEGVSLVENQFTGEMELEGTGFILEGNEFRDSNEVMIQGDDLTIRDNDFISSVPGVGTWVIQNSSIQDNSFSYDSFLSLMIAGGGCIFKDNVFNAQMCFLSFAGTEAWHFDNDVDETNTVNGKPIFYLFNETGTELGNVEAGCVFAFNCSDLRIHNISLAGGTVGLALLGVQQSRVENITSTAGSGATMALVAYSNENTLRDSRIHHIQMDESRENILQNIIFNGEEGFSIQHENLPGLSLASCENNIIRDCELLSYGEEAVNIRDSQDNSFSNCTLKENELAFKVASDSLNNTIINCDIFDNNWGINASSDGENQLDARNNWWGHESGPFHETENPQGQGDVVSNNVLFKPWLEEASEDSGEEDDDTTFLELSPLVTVIFLGLILFIALVALLYITSEGFSYTLLSILAPFYSRIAKEEVLDNLTRAQVYDHIRDHPGDHISEISRKLGFDLKTIVYHMNVLRDKREIRVVRNGKFVQCFLKGEEVDTLTPLQRRLMAFITENPGKNFGELQSGLGVKERTLRQHLGQLEPRLEVKRDGKFKRYFVNT